MINWCNWYRYQVFVVFCCSFFSQQLVGVALEQSKLSHNLNSAPAQELDRSRWLARTAVRCEAIDPTYLEVYGFETQNYYIGICQLADDFYYYRQSKQHQTEILVPAQAVSRDFFQASDGKTVYFVGKNGDRYYSSVMQNDNEMVFEPELQLPSATLSQDVVDASSELSQADLSTNQASNASLEFDNSAENSEPVAQVCVREQSASHPHLEGWQKLIGKSPDTANKYAVNNGHDFSYDDRTPNLASIATEEGTVINLNIAAVSETIEEVCLQPLAEN